jgi:hypothetical protein
MPTPTSLAAQSGWEIRDQPGLVWPPYGCRSSPDGLTPGNSSPNGGCADTNACAEIVWLHFPGRGEGHSSQVLGNMRGRKETKEADIAGPSSTSAIPGPIANMQAVCNVLSDLTRSSERGNKLRHLTLCWLSWSRSPASDCVTCRLGWMSVVCIWLCSQTVDILRSIGLESQSKSRE